MTTPATKPTRSTSKTKSTTKPAAPAKAAAKPAAKTKSAAKPVDEVAAKRASKTSAAKSETPDAAAKRAAKSATPKLDEQNADHLAQLHGQMTNAVTAYEALVCALLVEGISPTAIGKAVGAGNSVIRRIGMRNGLAVK